MRAKMGHFFLWTRLTAQRLRALVPQSESRARVSTALAAAACVAPSRNMPDIPRRRALPADDDGSPKPAQDFRTVALVVLSRALPRRGWPQVPEDLDFNRLSTYSAL